MKIARAGLFGFTALLFGLFFVFNHALATEIPFFPPNPPIGHVDEITANGVIRGWALDPDADERHIQIHVYFDGPAGSGTNLTGGGTNLTRCDVKYSANDCGYGRGFEIPIPENLRDNKTHTAYVYAIGLDNDFAKDGKNTQLIGSPISFKINSNIRHPRGTVVIQGSTIYFLGSELRYPFPTEEIFLSWGHSFNAIVPLNTGDFAMPIGPVVSYKQPEIKPLPPVPQPTQDSLTIITESLDEAIASVSVFQFIDYDCTGNACDFVATMTGLPPGLEFNQSFDYYGFVGTPTQVGTYNVSLTLTAIDGTTTTKTWSLSVREPTEQEAFEGRDGERLLEILGTIAALSLYGTDNGNFPSSLNVLTPKYLTEAPVAPIPPDGICTAEENQYKYTRLDSGNNFELSYCLGGAFVSEDPEAIGVITYNFFDEAGSGLFEAQIKSRDARRIADVNQIRLALELSFDQYGNYPLTSGSLPQNLVTDGFINSLPEAPTQPDGTCTTLQNKYTYAPLNNGQDYSVSFCLGTNTAGFSPGVHTASINGIN
jgi:hypothetical protein